MIRNESDSDRNNDTAHRSAEESAPPTNPAAGNRPPARKKRLGVQVGFTFIPIYKSKCRGRTIYQVPVRQPGSSKRMLKTFCTREEAEAFATAIGNGSRQEHMVFAQISPEELKNACLVASLLKPFVDKLGIGLPQAIEEYIEARTLAGTRGLCAVVKDYLDQPWVAKSRTPFLTAMEDFIEAKRRKGCRPETLRTLRYALDPFGRQINDPAVGYVTSRQLNARIHRPGYSTRGNKTIYCGLHNFFGWLKRNCYLRADVPCAMDAVEGPVVDHTPPEIIDVESARSALRILADQADPEYTLVMALGLFTGTRMDEMQGLLMAHVDPGQQIAMPAPVAKLHKPRQLPILPVMDAWLRPFYGRRGYINTRLDPQIRIGAILRKAGIHWKRNWLRHSYCTYRVNATGDLLETSNECGNSPAVIASSYLKRVTPAQAEEYFRLTPEACGIADWDQRVAAYIAKAGECHALVRLPRKLSQTTPSETAPA